MADAIPTPPPMPQGPLRDVWQSPADLYMNVRFGNDNPPFPAAAKYSFEWWFNQFWRECPDADRRNFYVETLNPNGTPKNPNMTNAERRDILGRMLRSGFIEFTSEYAELDDVSFPRAGSQLEGVSVAFRGDFRTPSEVRLQEGTYAKASIPVLRASMNMSQPWHPYSDPRTRMKLYFRRCNADNCLFTVVSVAEDFADATKFPLMSDMAESQFGAAVVTARGYTAGENVRALAANFGPSVSAPARPGGTVQKILKASRSNVYIVKTYAVFNTRRMQAGNPFPERAVRGIPWSHHLARIRIDRIHYGTDSNHGHLIVVHGVDWLHPWTTLVRTLRSSAALGRLEAYLHGIQTQGALVGGRGGISFKTALSNPEVEIERVIKLDLVGAWL